MIMILLKELCENRSIDIKTINKETKIAISTLQNLCENRSISINFSTLEKILDFFKIKDINEIMKYIVIERSEYNFNEYDESEYR